MFLILKWVWLDAHIVELVMLLNMVLQKEHWYLKKLVKTKVKVQRYICKRCDKTFQTDLTSLVDKNSNFTNELKSESEHLISDYLGSLKNVCKSFKKILWNHSFHIKQLKNWLFVNENIFRIWFRALLRLLCLWCRMAKNQRRMENIVKHCLIPYQIAL